MRNAIRVFVIAIAGALYCSPAFANSCKTKVIKTKQVCGVVVNSSGVPINGAKVQLIYTDGRALSGEATSDADGRFSLTDAPAGHFSLAVTASDHNRVAQPLVITKKNKQVACKKPLVVHLAGVLGSGCFDWVSKK